MLNKIKLVAQKAVHHVKRMVGVHTDTRRLTETIIVPEHAERTASAEFNRSVKRLKDDGHYRCWICGKEHDIQVHHFGMEWSLEADCDLAKLKELMELFDFYGYGRLLKNLPMDSVDDVRNMLCLCQEHHTGKGEGIHEITFPAWISQKTSKDGCIPIPQKGDGQSVTSN